MQRAILTFANCQGPALLKLLSLHPVMKEYKRSYITAWEDNTPSDEDLAQVKIVLYQKSFGIPKFLDRLPPDAIAISFPAVSCATLFPYAFNRGSEAVGWRFPYGDRFLIGKVKEGMSAEEAADGYMAHDVATRMKARRLLDFDISRWEALDRDHDVKIADFLQARFATHRLFFTPDHPSDVLMIELVNRILAKLGQPGFVEPDWASHAHCLSTVEIPIHPSILDALGLTAIAKDHRYSFWEGRGSAIARDWYRRYADALHHPTIAQALARAARHVESGETEEAREICVAALRQEPGNPLAQEVQQALKGGKPTEPQMGLAV
jgi:hypothetical protein